MSSQVRYGQLRGFNIPKASGSPKPALLDWKSVHLWMQQNFSVFFNNKSEWINTSTEDITHCPVCYSRDADLIHLGSQVLYFLLLVVCY